MHFKSFDINLDEVWFHTFQNFVAIFDLDGQTLWPGSGLAAFVFNDRASQIATGEGDAGPKQSFEG